MMSLNVYYEKTKNLKNIIFIDDWGWFIDLESNYYDFELLHLVLPNVYISNGSAGILDDYPYFYVKLYNASSKPSATKMITNNPNSREAIFSAPMDLNLTTQSFFTLSTKNPIQQMTFKPDDNLHFSVCLPNGEPLQFRENDWFSPASPNPFLQISVVFSIKRIG